MEELGASQRYLTRRLFHSYIEELMVVIGDFNEFAEYLTASVKVYTLLIPNKVWGPGASLGAWGGLGLVLYLLQCVSTILYNA